MAKTFSNLEPHPLTDIFPLMEGEEFDQLVGDIKANGLREPIMLYQDKILDGRNRYRVVAKAGLGYTLKEENFRDYSGDKPVEFVISANIHRRHLSESQRSLIAAQLATFGHGGDRTKAPIGGLSQEDAAKLLNVGERSVERAANVLKNGNPKLADAVRKGQVTVGAAERFADSDKQDELLKTHKGDLVKAVKATAPGKPTIWEALKEKLDAVEFDKIEAAINDLINHLQAYLKIRKEIHEARAVLVKRLGRLRSGCCRGTLYNGFNWD